MNTTDSAGASGSTPGPTPGWTTSEFWVTIATNVIALAVALATIFGHTIDPAPFTALVPAVAVLAAAIAAGFYAHSRGVVKSAAASAAPSVAGAAPTSAVAADAPTGASAAPPVRATSSASTSPSNSPVITADSPLVWALVPWSTVSETGAATAANGHRYAGMTGARS